MQKSIRQLNNIVLVMVVFFTGGCAVQSQTAVLRVATFNAALNRSSAGALYQDLQTGSTQARKAAQIIQMVRPDILLLNEFDDDSEHLAVRCFMQHYLAVSQDGHTPIAYPYYYTGPVNTGVPSGHDLDKDGRTDGPGDAFGYGQFPGQYGMVVLSKYPIHREAVRTFQRFLWKDMPNALLPDNPAVPEEADWYTPEELQVVRLSSKSHWDIPVRVGSRTLHLLAAHPTPPVFDGPEDRNGRRNHDEIRFWADYLTQEKAAYIYDDRGRAGGLAPDALFVVLGDLNADPCDGDSTADAVKQLLRHPKIQDPQPPTSFGAERASTAQQGVNLFHKGPSSQDTYQSLPDQAPGNLRLDYVLPSCKINVLDSAVFWPLPEHRAAVLLDCSDHRLVYCDITLNRSR